MSRGRREGQQWWRIRRGRRRPACLGEERLGPEDGELNQGGELVVLEVELGHIVANLGVLLADELQAAQGLQLEAAGRRARRLSGRCGRPAGLAPPAPLVTEVHLLNGLGCDVSLDQLVQDVHIEHVVNLLRRGGG